MDRSIVIDVDEVIHDRRQSVSGSPTSQQGLLAVSVKDDGHIPDTEELYSMFDPKTPAKLASFGGVAGLAAKFNTDMEHGMPVTAMETSIERYGTNCLPPAQFKSLLQLVWEALQDKTLIMLIVAACISLAVGMPTEGVELGWKDGVAVLVAVAFVVIVTSVNDYQKEQQFRRLNDVKNDRLVTAIRDGERHRISIYDLVVGDIVILETGDIIPADGVFLKGSEMQTDESSATGESQNIKKGNAPERDPFFLSGTQLVAGTGQMLVVNVGVHSFNGRIMLSLRAPSVDTPLQEKLAKLANIIGNFGIVASLFIFFVQLIKYFAIEGENVDRDDALNNTVDFLVIAISIVVVAVPEGLPLAVTIALAYSMKYMMRENNLVRRLDACETMGGATTICSDKTGTLTQNRMTVVEGILFNKRFSEDQPLDIEEKTGKSKSTFNESALSFLFESISVNSTAYETSKDDGTIEFVGNRTECALLQFAQKYGCDYSQVRQDRPNEKVFSFSSDRKRMCTVSKAEHPFVKAKGLPNVLHVKGAAEIVLSMCDRIVAPDGSIVDIEANQRDNFKNLLTQMGEQALRSICVAYKPIDDVEDHTNDENPKLICLAVVGIRDPLRPEVKDAVKSCQNAGVVVRMVTGDSSLIARNIATSCAIFDESKGHICMEGPEFRSLSDEEVKKVLPNLRILARSSPTDKFRLVTALQELREVVAVTGDGVNDGPALKKADVGFSMGISGTDVAKEASAIVLLDDNFTSIVNAIKWGRNVFDNIRKFLQFQLTVNFTAILVVFITVISDDEGNADNSPLKPVQLLWINLIMDSFAAIALATEPPTEKLLQYKPYDRNEPLITRYMGRHMVLQIILQTATFLTITYAGDSWFDTEKQPDDDTDAQFSTRHYTVIFNAFVLSQLFNQFNARKLHQEVNVFSGLHRHRIFIGVWLFAFAVQVLIVQFGGTALEVESLNGKQWLGCIITGLLPLVWGLIFHLMPRSVTTDEWPWFKSVKYVFEAAIYFTCCCFMCAGKRAERAEKKERRQRKREARDAAKSRESAYVQRQPGEKPAGEGAQEELVVEDVKPIDISESQAISLDASGARNRLEESADPRTRWANAIWAVMQQIEVVDKFRRHHR